MREYRKSENQYRLAFLALLLVGTLGVSFLAGIFYSTSAAAAPKKKPRVVYKARYEVDFEGIELRGELKRPGEFYFRHRREEKFNSLVKRRKNFHHQMLRDIVMSK